MINKIINKVVHQLAIKLHQQNRHLAKSIMPEFGNKPQNLTIELPYQIDGSDRIFVGDNVRIGPNSILRAQRSYPGKVMKHPGNKHKTQVFDSNIIIGDRVTATGGLHMVAFEKITIEDDVMFASNIFICDGFHAYETTNTPYKYQGIAGIAPITIKYGSWIGQNVVINPNVTIGEMSIIGANSVVTKNIGPRCIAVGVPARVIKRWDDKTNSWISKKQ